MPRLPPAWRHPRRLSLVRLGRSIQDLIAIVAGLRRRGIGFQSLHEPLDTPPGGRLVFQVFAALAEFIRELIAQGAHGGLAAARARGERIGRPPAMTEEQVRHARGLLTGPENTITSIAKLLGVSRTTLYKYVPQGAWADRLPALTTRRLDEQMEVVAVQENKTRLQTQVKPMPGRRGSDNRLHVSWCANTSSYPSAAGWSQ